jgi:hypothetical protein
MNDNIREHATNINGLGCQFGSGRNDNLRNKLQSLNYYMEQSNAHYLTNIRMRILKFSEVPAVADLTRATAPTYRILCNEVIDICSGLQKNRQ